MMRTKNLLIVMLSCFCMFYAFNANAVNIKIALKKSAEDVEASEDDAQQKRHLAAYQPPSAKSDLTQVKVREGLGNLGPAERPLPVPGQLYVKDDATGTAVLVQRDDDGPLSAHPELTVYDSDGPGKINFLSLGDGIRWKESFAHTREVTYGGSRKYPLNPYQYRHATEDDTEIKFDRGHGIDHADGDKASSADLSNYTPQVSFYNEHIRNPLVKRIRAARNGSYKEIVIYDSTETIAIDGRTPLPIGFIFIEFVRHKIKHTYYFPNLIDYKSLGLKGYQAYCDFFEIDDQGAFLTAAVKEGDAEEHRREVNEHSRMGYRALSGDFQIVSETRKGIPRAAQSALHRMLAVHHLDQAGELEFSSVEEKSELVRTFSSSMKYITFDKGDPRKKAVRTKRRGEFWEALTQAGISMDDFMFLTLANSEKLIPEAQEKQRRIFEIQEMHALSEEEKEGEDLYDMDKARYWLSRIEEQIARGSLIDDKIKLLELYQITELRDEKKEEDLSQELEIQGKEGSIEDLRIIASYFWEKKDKERADIWLQRMERALFESRNMDDKLAGADWYVRGRGEVVQFV